MHAELLIDGHFFGGPCDQSIGKTQHYAPYDGMLVGTAAEAGWAEVDAALNAAKLAQASWSRSAMEVRSQLLQRVSKLISDRRTELAELMAREIGKPITVAFAEVDRCSLTFKLAAEFALGVFDDEYAVDYDQRGKDYTVTARRFPIGVILAIVPYNWPLNLTAHKVAPALAAGNTVVVKAPGLGTLTTLTLGRILHECGCPAGVVNFIHCASPIAQNAALDQRTAMVSFTGSPQVGWMLKSLLPKKPVALELGGDATAVVEADADLEWAVNRLVSSAFTYAGQICISTQHILIQEAVFDEFVSSFVEKTESCVTGEPLHPDTICGPVASSESADRIMDCLQDAEDKGATILAGGNRTGLVIEPTVLRDVPTDSILATDEIFGPVVTVSPYRSLSEAIERINSSKFGLQAALFTKAEDKIAEFYEGCNVGGVVINDSPSIRFDSMPYGGNKESGFGREGIACAFHEMTTSRAYVKRN